MTIKSFLLPMAFAVLSATGCPAQDFSAARPITSVYGLEAGAANINCNYLSPLPYTGTGVALYGAWGKRMKQHPQDLAMAFTAGLEMCGTKNPAKTAGMLSVAGRFGWGPSWVRSFDHGLELNLGGALDLFGGVLWLPINGNNPAQALAYTGLDLTARLAWKTHFGRLPVTIADRAALPAIGAFFMPAFGESYYEIYLGNHSGLAHFGWWGNSFGLDNHLTMTLHFKNKKSLVLGYRLAVRNNRNNHLTNQYVRNAFTVALQIN